MRRDTDGDGLLNVEEAARFLKVSVPALRLWTRQQRVASHRFGKRVLYSVADLRAFVAASRRPARSEAVSA